MSRPISLAIYRTLMRRRPMALVSDLPPRPAGGLVWMHLGNPDAFAAVKTFAQRLMLQRPELSVVLTMRTRDEPSVEGDIILTALPKEHPQTVEHFLDHWNPDLVLWFWGGLRPNLLDGIVERNIPLHLIDGDMEGLDRSQDRWLPDMVRHLLAQAGASTALNTRAARRMEKLGIPAAKLEVRSAISETTIPPSCSNAEIDDFSAHLAGRPVWLAARSTPQEWPLILSAQRQILQSAHRLLLVLHPENAEDADRLEALLVESDLSYKRWSDGTYPTDATQVLLADLSDELGLWYRLSTITLMCGSFPHGSAGRDPMQAAALGSAVLYGPNVHDYLDAYKRLTAAGAARIVNDAASVAQAVIRLIAPDQAAAMAHAGWDVATEGAASIDSLLALVSRSLDLGQADDAERNHG